MQSNTITLYKTWLATAAVPQIAFVDAVYAMCEEHYGEGGDSVVECLSPGEILAEFTTLEDVKRYCGLLVEQALNTRWGEDNDPEIARAERFREWE
jgi:hypothetical protein